MTRRMKLAASAICGVGAAAAVHLSPAESILVSLARERVFRTTPPPEFLRFPWIVSAVAGLVVFLLLLLLLKSLSGRSISPPHPGRDEEEAPASLYEKLNTLLKEFARTVKHRRDPRSLLKDGTAPPEYFDLLYQYRKENFFFLSSLLNTMKREKSRGKEYLSDSHPELVVEEARGMLQKTLYIAFPRYIRRVKSKVTTSFSRKAVEWKEFRETVSEILCYASSLKECIAFYLDMCRNEKNKFNKFLDYGVLPLEVGMPSDADLFQLVEERRLGEDFDYNALVEFKEHLREYEVRFNPSIPEVFEFFDASVTDILQMMNALLTKARPLFCIYQLAVLSPAYERIEWIKANISLIKPESLSYYIETLAASREELKEDMKKIGLSSLPPPLLQWEEMDKIKETLEKRKKASGESQVIYKTDALRKKGRE